MTGSGQLVLGFTKPINITNSTIDKINADIDKYFLLQWYPYRREAPMIHDMAALPKLNLSASITKRLDQEKANATANTTTTVSLEKKLANKF